MKKSLHKNILIVLLILFICLLVAFIIFLINNKANSMPVAKIERLADNKLKLTCTSSNGIKGYVFSKDSVPDDNSNFVSVEGNRQWSIEQVFDGNGVYYLECVNKANELSNIASYGEWAIPNSYEFIVTKTGYYKLEIWGAQGGNTKTSHGGKGGYSVGYKKLEKGETIYLAVGSKGNDALPIGEDYVVRSGFASGGSNGGGAGISNKYMNFAAGGGATHIATLPGVLYTLFDNKNAILMVAGGGGGAIDNGKDISFAGGNGGGVDGLDGESNTSKGGKGGNQLNGGSGYAGEYDCTNCDMKQSNKDTAGGFGYGANICGNKEIFENYSSSFYDCYSGAGGGGGYYGGGSGYMEGAGGGGSGYIGGVEDGSMESGVREGHGKIVITWYGTSLSKNNDK